jgi:hypothetical protein
MVGDDELLPEADLLEYTAFQRWEYKQIIYKTDHAQSWRNLAHSFFRASLLLVQKVAARELYDENEGLAAIFLFRHYLELALKELVGDVEERPFMAAFSVRRFAL